MHWTLPQLRALRMIEYEALVDWLHEQQQKAAESEREHAWE